MQPWQPSVPPPAVPAPPAERPSSIQGGAIMLLATAVLSLVETATVIFMLVRQVQHSQQEYGAGSSDATAFTVIGVVMIGINLVLLIGLVGAAFFALQGRPAGRALAWGFGIPSALMRLLCGTVGGIGTAASLSPGGSNDPYPHELFAIVIGADLLALVAIVLGLVLLNRRDSRLYFRAIRGR